ncbi:putative WW domain-containing oxidoreductase [Hypsibius exemplaris]|uniref:WW domain-containing oxidoreductase n=1 Tax=Hypsibius exemplaris TaxID=2072580 RepID=A0A1W0WS13_HYPEX|nr:putative WW domain-containing oxidoreductase [Hypsibius exemplaris]
MAPPRLDFKRRFNSCSSATQILQDEIVEGKTVLITGGSSGIGVATVEAFANKAAHVIFTGRNVQSANDLIQKIKVTTPHAKVHFMPVDLLSLKDVRRFAEEFTNHHGTLDIVIFNAGMFGGSHVITEDGYEAAFQVNVLSQLYLLGFLKPLILKATGPRIIFVSSDWLKQTTISLSNLSEEVLSPSANSYPWRQYANSKFCQVLLSQYIQTHWGSLGVNSYSLHPGNLIATNVVRQWRLGQALAWLFKPFTKTLDQGAATTVYCAAAAELADHGGEYWADCWIAESFHGKQPKLAEAVWNLCEKMISAKVPDDYTRTSS